MPARLTMADENADTPGAKIKAVRRRLFVDNAQDKRKDEIDRQLEQERSRHLQEKKAKWNFDFKEERPLDGQWQWVPVDKTSERRSNRVMPRQDVPENTDANVKRINEDSQKQAL